MILTGRVLLGLLLGWSQISWSACVMRSSVKRKNMAQELVDSHQLAELDQDGIIIEAHSDVVDHDSKSSPSLKGRRAIDGQYFIKNGDQVIHSKGRVPGSEIKCAVAFDCKFSSTKVAKFASHLRAVHGCDYPIGCAVCDQMFQRLPELTAHSTASHPRIIRGFTDWRCYFEGCEYKNLQLANLTSHLSGPDHAKAADTLICPFENCGAIFEAALKGPELRAARKKMERHIVSTHRGQIVGLQVARLN